jgi:hypothetical protein
MALEKKWLSYNFNFFFEILVIGNQSSYNNHWEVVFDLVTKNNTIYVKDHMFKNSDESFFYEHLKIE